MVSYRMIAVAGFLASVSALPLNINLGAYSPALVVGDGEISFGGGQDVTNLMNALEGAAVNAATGTTRNAAAASAAGTENVAAAATPAAADTVVAAQSNNVAAAAATPVASETAKAPVASAATTSNVDPNLQQQATQISGLQGMGKEIAPRDDEAPKAKRDLAGFDRALKFAEAALTKGPTIQLGTGEGGAGVGIIVDNNGRKVGEAAKRDVSSAQPRRRTKVTRMYVKRGVPATIQTSSEFETRSVESLPVVNLPAVAKRQSSTSNDVIDSINLNVDDQQGFTMTFVETTEDADDAAIDETEE
ncbi:uncharacterized protein GGS22DRAFT_37673 [Annulohypoxylon maeteangense]|uniref:uncharacterized protein n=1 Tax=Annulohypoxylon maeteangense TaxID=1927788 RepID=UPI00200742E2|nr:uncharacterized protein GGS22DRAFT_37673 [Annulohypoxylon maeteangense]KAI0883233.1 hypothetical protein GGS22DRAFT_37673 [Annulohypoxylon maeteangense]